ncbi:MAG: flavodoxin [Deltaproteobacteria bacterium]|nr:flavodoxin [Deltaproteobacteria bacterium]
MLQTWFKIAFSFLALAFFWPFASIVWAADPPPAAAKASPRILIAYFSWSGNCKTLASAIQGVVGGDIFEIRPKVPYPTSYDTTVEIGKKEKNEGARPAIDGMVEDLSRYDVVILGYPIWWGEPPMAVYTFLESGDFAGKVIVPYCSHKGSGLSGTVEALKKKLPNSTVTPGLAVRDGEAGRSGEAIAAWLKLAGLNG